jgi:hypothetical protein
MPLAIPNLDDRNFSQLLAEAQRRIPSFTPEWTNYGLDSDPGNTLIQIFAFLTETLLYRVNRYPDANRLKFLQLLGTPLRPASPASGMVTITNARGPIAPLPLEQGIQVAAGSVGFATASPVNVLPLDTAIYYKKQIAATDPQYQTYQTQYEAVKLAAEASGSAGTTVQLVFYETVQLPAPTTANPSPSIDLSIDPMDKALYIAVLAPANAQASAVISAIANQTLCIGIVPATAGQPAPLQPLRLATKTTPSNSLIFEMPANFGVDVGTPQYVTITPLAAPDVLSAPGIVQLPLPAASAIGAWTFTDPMSEGTEDFPPKIEDPTISARLLTWVRIRLRPPSGANGTSVVPSAKLTWAGINAATVYQAVPVVNEVVGTGSGEPDQSFALANSPVLPSTLTVTVQDRGGQTPASALWGQTESLSSAGAADAVYAIDPEAGTITFGDGIHGARPGAGARIIASYQYGGGVQGNVGIGAISTSSDPRLQGGYTIQNPVPTSGGAAGQTVDDAEQNIPLVIRHKDRAVTAQDFADVAMETPGVSINRIDILPLFVPGPPAQDNVAGTVTLMAVPLTDPVNPLWPMPDLTFLNAICAYLDTRRLVTTEIYVRGPDYVPVYVSVGIAVQAGYFPDLVQQSVTAALRNYLSSLRGLGPAGNGWPLRKTLLDKDLEAAVTRVDGVEYVNSLLLGVNNATAITQQSFTGLQLPRLDGVSVSEGDPDPLASVLGAVVQPAQPGVSIVPVPVVKTTC